jgi:hypothetical protein
MNTGFGTSALRPGEPIPPRDVSGHAWNAVQIDDGQWKLIDPCWGAGAVNGKNQPYIKRFAPERFTQTNEEFGIDHYPENSRYFFREDGRPSITWEEYILSDAGPEKCQIYGGARDTHGLDDKSFLPKFMDVKSNDPAGGPTVRFQFNKVCQHYDNVRIHGKPYIFFVKIQRPGREEDFRVFQTDGYFWWLDVSREDLGNRGDDIFISYAQHYNKNKTDGRGLTEAEFQRGVRMGKPGGWHGWSWGQLGRWKVV